MKIKYEADDGTQFDTEQECIRHEMRRRIPEDIDKAIHAFAAFCRGKECNKCPFYSDYDIDCLLNRVSPCDWENARVWDTTQESE